MAIVAALGGFGGWAALSTDASTGHATQESQLSEAYGQARYAVARFELAVREDQLEPTPANRRRVDAALTALRATLPAIDRNGDARDRALTAELRRQIGATAIGVGHLMTAAESFDAVGVHRLNRVEVAPHLDRIEDTVDAAATAHRAGLSAGLASARRSQGVALGATFVMFVLGLLLTGAVVGCCTSSAGSTTCALRDRPAPGRGDAGQPDGPCQSPRVPRVPRRPRRGPRRLLACDRGSRRAQADERHVRAPGRRRSCSKVSPAPWRRFLPTAARFGIGGDEFAIVVDGGTAIEAFGIAQDIRERVDGRDGGRGRARARRGQARIDQASGPWG